MVSDIATFGNRDFAVKKLEPLVKLENYGYNQLHFDALSLSELTEKYATQSITKAANSDKRFTPLHFACVNPNVAVLEKLLK